MNLAISTNCNLGKCGEITAALKLGKIVLTLNCGFCSKVFIKLHALTLHVSEKHEQELFGCLQDESCDGDDDSRKVDNCPNKEYNATRAMDSEEGALDLQYSLEQLPLTLVYEEIPALSVKEEKVETMANEGNDDGNMDQVNNQHFNYDSSEVETSYDSDNQQDELVEVDETPINDELTLAIITEYEKHRILWDANKPVVETQKQRIEAFQTIATSINKQMSQNLKWNNISDRIKKLNHQYRSGLQSQKLAKSRSEDYTPIWYYDRLSFLNASIEKVQQHTNSVKKASECALPLTNLTDEQNLELIEIYKGFPCLWEVQHIEFRFKNRRREAIIEMIEEIKIKMSLELTEKELQKIIRSIHEACKQDKCRKLRCERFKIEFTPSCTFYEQISFLNDNISPFKCDFCEETFNAFTMYTIHKSKHDKSKPFTCSICSRGFMAAANLTVHLRRHTRDYPFECKLCKKRFPTKNDVNIHMRGHTGEKPYFCEICGKSFRTWPLFDNHIRRHQKRPSHICTICSKGFYDKTIFTDHMNGHLNIRDKVCNVCGKSFTSSKNLRRHKLIHAEKKKYVCRICKKDFAQYAGLSAHMKSHGTTVSGTSSAIIIQDNQHSKL